MNEKVSEASSNSDNLNKNNDSTTSPQLNLDEEVNNKENDLNGATISARPSIGGRKLSGGPSRMTTFTSHRLLRPIAKGFRARVLRFQSSWFSVTMGTGIVSTLLFNLPWPAVHPTFRTIASAFLIFDIGLFLSFTIMSIARYALYPAIFSVMLQHETDSLFLGTIPMGAVTIISGIARIGVEYGLEWTLDLALVLWWFSLVLSVLTAFGVPYIMFTMHKHTSEGLTALWLLPVVPPITIAAVGSSLCKLLIERGRFEYALLIMITSYIMNGVGLLLACGIMIIYFNRLALHHLPPKEMIISVFLPIGPCGQGGFALIELGRVAVALFPKLLAASSESSGIQDLALVGPAMFGSGIVAGLLLFGLGVWWLFIAVISVIPFYRDKNFTFSMGWWSLTFPLGSLALLTFSLGNTFDSLFFNIIATLMTTGVVSAWLYVFVPTSIGFFKGTLFPAPCLKSLPPDYIKAIGGGKGKELESALFYSIKNSTLPIFEAILSLNSTLIQEESVKAFTVLTESENTVAVLLTSILTHDKVVSTTTTVTTFLGKNPALLTVIPLIVVKYFTREYFTPAPHRNISKVTTTTTTKEEMVDFNSSSSGGKGKNDHGEIEVSYGKEKLRVPLPPPNSPLSSLKAVLFNMTGISPDHQTLIANGAILKDDLAPLSAFGLVDEFDQLDNISASEKEEAVTPSFWESWSFRSNKHSSSNRKLKKLILIGSSARVVEDKLSSRTIPPPEEVMEKVIEDESTVVDKIGEISGKKLDELLPEIDKLEAWLAQESRAGRKGEGESIPVEGEVVVEKPHPRAAIFLSEALLQTLLRLDGFDIPSTYLEARKERKEAVRKLQGALDRVDTVKEALKSKL